MKLKRLPADFIVEELSDFVLGDGPFAVYQLDKRSIGTPEAITAICERWNLPRKRLSYGGLKDKHAITRQYVTIHHGQKRHLNQGSFDLTYMGQAAQHFTAQDIAGNCFTVVMRDLTSLEAEQAVAAVADVQDSGLPNYFDDQRFGSLGVSGEWIAKFWCQGNYERALWLAMAEPHKEDRANERREKEILREHWGKWVACKAALDRSHRRSLVTNLADKEAVGKPPEFRMAFGCLNIDLRGLYLSAFQSALWNRLLTMQLQTQFPSERLVPFELESGRSYFIRGLTRAESEPLTKTLLPLPAARQKIEPGPLLDMINRVCADEGMEMRELRVKYPRDSFFSKGLRAACVQPTDMTARIDDDELYPRHKKVLLTFGLPRGSYATILVKRLTGGAGSLAEET